MSSGSELRQRWWHLTVRLTLAERAFINANAERAGLTPGSYVRQQVLGGSVERQVRKRPIEHKELVRLLGAVGHIGANINQLAKARNTGLIVYETDLSDAARAILDMRDALLTALGRTP